ncbi:hypothetical protein BGX26_006307 [Mortierella sp. AD094]|nr:hypothetical protein BGX26_006307 [Mortierella sp. AD094]
MATKEQFLLRGIANLAMFLSMALNIGWGLKTFSIYSPDGIWYMRWREWTGLAIQILLFFILCCPLFVIFCLMQGEKVHGPKPINRWKRALPIIVLNLALLAIAISVIVNPRPWGTGTFCNHKDGCRNVTGGPVSIYHAWSWVAIFAALLNLVEAGYSLHRSYLDYPKQGRSGEGKDEEYKIHTIDPPLPTAPAPAARQAEQQREQIENIVTPARLQQQQQTAGQAIAYPQSSSNRQQPHYTSIYNRPAAPDPAPARRLLLEAPASR